MIPGNQVLGVRPRGDATLSLETLSAPGVSHQGQILGVWVPVLWAVPASLMGWHVDHAILSAKFSPSGGNINHSEALKNASAHWTVPISWAQPHHGKALRVQPLHFALVDLFIERGLESELIEVVVQRMLPLVRI